jgi:TetR/AcrR family transcriptional repressor of nem operon
VGLARGGRINFKKLVDGIRFEDEHTNQLVVMRTTAKDSGTKEKIVEAAMKLMRAQGFNATSVDEICQGAGVTKGAFFHYFKSKDELAAAAVGYFRDQQAREIQEAPFRKLNDPLERVFGRLDFVKESVGGAARVTKGCLIGTFAQEISFTHPELRAVCQESFARIARDLEKDLSEAKALYAPKAVFDPKSVAMLYVSIVQGSLMLAKASADNSVLMSNIEQFRQHLEGLFGKKNVSGEKRGARISVGSNN